MIGILLAKLVSQSTILVYALETSTVSITVEGDRFNVEVEITFFCMWGTPILSGQQKTLSNTILIGLLVRAGTRKIGSSHAKRC